MRGASPFGRGGGGWARFGALTRFILPGVARLHLVEVDRDLAAFLEANLVDPEVRVSFHRQDILRFDFHSVAEREGEGLVVLGNLPYNISSPLVFRLLESRKWIKRAVLMVQKEVGERLTASPGGKDYGVLSVLLGVYARVQSLFTVGPGSFTPLPRWIHWSFQFSSRTFLIRSVLRLAFCGAL